MQAYLNLLNSILDEGTVRQNRTGIDAKGVNFHHSAFDTEFGKKLPIITTKRVPTSTVLGELLGFVRGLDNAAGFRTMGCKIWDANANEKGVDEAHPNRWLNNPVRKGVDDLGRIYGVQWRDWEDTKIRPSDERTNAYYIEQGYEEATQFLRNGKMFKVWTRRIDQLKNVVDKLREDSTDRRCIISAWNPGELNEMALPPCHLLQHYLCESLTEEERLAAHIVKYESVSAWQSNSMDGVQDNIKKQFMSMAGTSEEKLNSMNAPTHKLDLVMYQRSADSVLGVPFNITSYGMLLHMVAQITGYAPGTLHYITGDTHIYMNHMDAVQEQLQRRPVVSSTRFLINPSISTLKDLERSSPKDFRVFNYNNHGPLNHPTLMAV